MSETKGARDRRRNQAGLLLPAGAGNGPRGQGAVSPGPAPASRQVPPNNPRQRRREALGGVRRKLEEEKDKEVRGVIKLRKKSQDMERSLGGGAGGAYRPVYLELLARDERYRREREGVITGIERAIDLVELEEEELEQQVPSLQASPQPESPAHRKTPHNVQSTGGGEK